MAEEAVPALVLAPEQQAQSAHAGEDRARRLVRDYFDFIWRMLRRLGVPHGDVDDAAQQVFWIAVRKIRPEQGGTDGAYLLSIALRVASEYRRRRRTRREVFDSEHADSPDESLSAEEQVNQKQALELADRLLETIPLDLRVVFVLFEIEEKSTLEIADLLRIPPGTVASRLRRGRVAFTQAVARVHRQPAAMGKRP